VACGLLAEASAAETQPTLAELAAGHGETPAGPMLAWAGERVTSFGVLDDAGTFLFAGYFASELEGSGLGPLRVIALDRATSRWAELRHAERSGAVSGIRRIGGFFSIRLHHTPSSDSELVLDSRLAVHDRVPGWVVAVVDERRVLYQKGQPHFAPTFETELFLYELATRKRSRIFPSAPDGAYRASLVERTARAYREAGERWCAERNHHCDPERLDSYLSAGPVTSAETDSLAFVVSYDEAPLESGGERRAVLYLVRGLTTGLLESVEVPLAPAADLPSADELRGFLRAETLRDLLERGRGGQP
jgi:hypothetical protein